MPAVTGSDQGLCVCAHGHRAWMLGNSSPCSGMYVNGAKALGESTVCLFGKGRLILEKDNGVLNEGIEQGDEFGFGQVGCVDAGDFCPDNRGKWLDLHLLPELWIAKFCCPI